MTLEGEYYAVSTPRQPLGASVAILMTLEGEYYRDFLTEIANSKMSRNPHDIGRRILQGILIIWKPKLSVAILMTLEGEYYFIFNFTQL